MMVNFLKLKASQKIVGFETFKIILASFFLLWQNVLTKAT